MLIEDEQLEEAVNLCENASELYPRNSSVAENHAEALRRLVRLDDALEVVDAAIDEVPDRPQLHYVRALVLEDRGQLQGALEALRSALSLRSDFEAAARRLKEIEQDR